jgi:WD40 repeat protein|tara:strand:+ start:1792 stop:2085 length:294 start_codon:yes stop_codon:yes gene_type:complete
VSADADGVVKLWDVRMVAEALSVDCGPHPANKVSFDKAGETVAVASDDGTVKCFASHDGELLAELRGHEDAVQGVLFDPNGEFLVSCSSDHTFRLWR